MKKKICIMLLFFRCIFCSQEQTSAPENNLVYESELINLAIQEGPLKKEDFSTQYLVPASTKINPKVAAAMQRLATSENGLRFLWIHHLATEKINLPLTARTRYAKADPKGKYQYSDDFVIAVFLTYYAFMDKEVDTNSRNFTIIHKAIQKINGIYSENIPKNAFNQFKDALLTFINTEESEEKIKNLIKYFYPRTIYLYQSLTEEQKTKDYTGQAKEYLDSYGQHKILLQDIIEKELVFTQQTVRKVNILKNFLITLGIGTVGFMLLFYVKKIMKK